MIKREFVVCSKRSYTISIMTFYGKYSTDYLLILYTNVFVSCKPRAYLLWEYQKNILVEQTSDAINIGSWSIRTQIYSHSCQFVLIFAYSYSGGQFVLMSWSIRSSFDQFVLILVNSFSI